jgi:hypothetical protein
VGLCSFGLGQVLCCCCLFLCYGFLESHECSYLLLLSTCTSKLLITGKLTQNHIPGAVMFGSSDARLRLNRYIHSSWFNANGMHLLEQGQSGSVASAAAGLLLLKVSSSAVTGLFRPKYTEISLITTHVGSPPSCYCSTVQKQHVRCRFGGLFMLLYLCFIDGKRTVHCWIFAVQKGCFYIGPNGGGILLLIIVQTVFALLPYIC